MSDEAITEPVYCVVCDREHDRRDQFESWIYHNDSDNVVCRECSVDEHIRLYERKVYKAACEFARELNDLAERHGVSFDDARMDNLSDSVEEWIDKHKGKNS